MPSISSLFYSSNPDKQTLHRRIVPSKEQMEMQQDRWHDLDEYLKEKLAEESGYQISSWIQGSYKFGTQVRPASKADEFDIDLGMYFNWEGSDQDGDYKPKALKSMVQTCLIKYKNETGEEVIDVVSPPKMRCDRIRFQEDFHIDIPVYHIDSAHNNRSLATEANEWEDSDPKALYIWFREQCQEDDDNIIRRIIRYLKIWAALNFSEEERPSTILLTVLAVEAFGNLSDEPLVEDDVALKNSVDYIIERLNNDSAVANPVDNTENLNRLDSNNNSNFIVKLGILSLSANRAIQSPTDLDAATIWQEIFSHFFPLPVDNNQSITQNALATVSFIPEIAIEASPFGNPSNIVTRGRNAISGVPKYCDIRFKLLNADSLPWDAQIQWMVRNEGQEAEFKNDLGHPGGREVEAKEESAYVGTHYMDVVIKSSIGIIIGFRRIPVTISGTFIAPRNKKKSWLGRPSKSQMDSRFRKLLQ